MKNIIKKLQTWVGNVIGTIWMFGVMIRFFVLCKTKRGMNLEQSAKLCVERINEAKYKMWLGEYDDLCSFKDFRTVINEVLAV